MAIGPGCERVRRRFGPDDCACRRPGPSAPATKEYAVTIRVVCGDDSYIARQGIVRALEEEDDIDVVATCGDADTLRKTVREVGPHVVLADISMPPTNTDEGIRLADELRTTQPEVGVVIISQYAEPLYATKLLEEGSARRAYLLKDRVQYRGDLTRAVREVAAGRSVVDPRIVELLLAAQRRRADSRFDTLTPREQEILALVAEGWSNAAIAERIVVTKRAVERHINSIFSKLGLGESERTSRRVKAALLYLAGQAG
jgi:DNA-binding NarL/FixJ family response regulator